MFELIGDLPCSSRAVFLDIDGTLNPQGFPPGDESILRPMTGYTVGISRRTVEWVHTLHASGVALVWSTTWNDEADDYAGWFGLPRGLPYLKYGPLRANAVSEGRSEKLAPIFGLLETARGIEKAVILDDMVGPIDSDVAFESEGRIFIPELHEHFGITDDIRGQVDAFLV